MNLRNRLIKLEQKAKPELFPLVMIPTRDNCWTAEQLQQMEEAEAQGRMIIRANFVKAKHVSD